MCMTSHVEPLNPEDYPHKFRSDMTVEVIDHMGTDHSAARAARVSTGRDFLEVNEKADAGLINALVRDRHGSALEHLTVTFRIEAPIFVFREFQRHRIASYSEASGRYRVMDGTFYVPPKDRPMKQVGKPMDYDIRPADEETVTAMRNAAENAAHVLWMNYNQLLSMGIAREVARNILPLSTYSSMYVTMNARGLMNFFSLRIGQRGRDILVREGIAETAESKMVSHPLLEIEEVALGMAREFATLYPVVWKAFTKNGWVSP